MITIFTFEARITKSRFRLTRFDSAQWNAQTIYLLFLIIAIIIYRNCKWQFKRSALQKKKSVIVKSERWSWQSLTELLTLGIKIDILRFTGYILGEAGERKRYSSPRWLFKRGMGFSQASERDKRESRAMGDKRYDENSLEPNLSHSNLNDVLKQQRAHPHHYCLLNKALSQEKLTAPLTQPQLKATKKEPEIDHQPTAETKQPTKSANFASSDMKNLHETEKGIVGLKMPEEYDCFDVCKNKSDHSTYFSVGSVKFPQCIDSNSTEQNISETTKEHESLQVENLKNTLLPKIYNFSSSTNIDSNADNPNDSDRLSVGNIGGDAFSIQPTSGLISFLVSTKNEMTQTEEPEGHLTSSKGTMTEACTVDCGVSTHGTPCKLVRHCGTTTTGPFMKKLRRAQRLLVEAKETSRSSQASTAAKWRKVLDRYKTKMEILTSHLAKKDELMGSTSSRAVVLRWEIKEAMLAVRSSTSTKERLNTQCKLNAALMDVIESKSDNPTYSAGLTDPAESLH